MNDQTSDMLILFSGGKDSFLTACRLINTGYTVHLLSIDNGCICGEYAFQNGANRLKEKYGENRCHYCGVYNATSIMQKLSDTWAQQPYADIAKKYPHIINAQLNCLHCQSAMWVSSIAYCIAKHIPIAACGYRSTDKFCTGLTDYCGDIVQLGWDNEIEIKYPVWITDWDKDENARNDEMKLYGFVPKVNETSCCLGRPVKEMTEKEQKDLIAYFRGEILPHMQDSINRLVPAFKNMQLTMQSTI